MRRQMIFAPIFLICIFGTGALFSTCSDSLDVGDNSATVEESPFIDLKQPIVVSDSIFEKLKSCERLIYWANPVSGIDIEDGLDASKSTELFFGAIGVILDVRLNNFLLPILSLPTNPLSCCISLLDSIENQNGDLYAKIAADAHNRTETGELRNGYIPDLKQMMFLSMYGTCFPGAKNSRIISYIKVDGMYVFSIEFLTQQNGRHITKVYDFAIEEYANGKFRYAYEFFNPFTAKYTYALPNTFLFTEDEVEKQLNDNWGNRHTIEFPNIFPGKHGEEKLRMVFSGGSPINDDFKSLCNVIEAVRKLEVVFSENENERIENLRANDLDRYFDNQSVEKIFKTQSFIDAVNVSKLPKMYAIDAGRCVYLFSNSSNNKCDGKIVTIFLKDDGKCKITNFGVKTWFEAFYAYEHIFPVISEALCKFSKE